MSTAAKSSKSVEIRREGTKIAEVTDISGPSATAGAMDATSLESTAKEHIADIPDNGSVQCEANSIASNAVHQALRADLVAGTMSAYAIVCPDGEQYAFNATVTALSPKFSNGALRKLSFTLKISGAVTPTYPA